jgi:hypothetical protein
VVDVYLLTYFGYFTKIFRTDLSELENMIDWDDVTDPEDALPGRKRERD